MAGLLQAPAQLRHMTPHGLLSSGRIMLFQIGQDLAMLSKRLVFATRDENDAKLMPDEWRMERVEKLINELMSRSLDDEPVKASDQWQMAEEVAIGKRFFHLCDEGAELGELWRRRLLGSKRRGEPLQHFAHLEDFGSLFNAKGADLGATVGLRLDKSLVLQANQYGPQGGTAHS